MLRAMSSSCASRSRRAPSPPRARQPVAIRRRPSPPRIRGRPAGGRDARTSRRQRLGGFDLQGHAREGRRGHREARAVRGAGDVDGLRRGQAALGRARAVAAASSSARRSRWRGGRGTELRTLIERLRELAKDDKLTGLVLRARAARDQPARRRRAARRDARLPRGRQEARVPHRGRVATRRTSCSRRATGSALAPLGDIAITGPAAMPIHIKPLLDKLGVQADFLHVGAYKGAAEPLTRDAPSQGDGGDARRDPRSPLPDDGRRDRRRAQARPGGGQGADRHRAVPVRAGQGREARRRGRGVRGVPRRGGRRRAVDEARARARRQGPARDDAQARRGSSARCRPRSPPAITSRWSTRSATSSTAAATACSARASRSRRTRWSRRCARSTADDTRQGGRAAHRLRRRQRAGLAS